MLSILFLVLLCTALMVALYDFLGGTSVLTRENKDAPNVGIVYATAEDLNLDLVASISVLLGEVCAPQRLSRASQLELLVAAGLCNLHRHNVVVSCGRGH